MKRNKIIALLCLVLCAALMLTSCGNKNTDTAVVETVTATDSPATDVPVAEKDDTAETTETAETETAEVPESKPLTGTVQVVPEGVDVVAVVNGEDVTYKEYDDIYNNLLSYYSQYGYDTSNEGLQGQLKAYALDSAVQMKLMMQKAREWGMDQLSAEETAQIESDVHAQWEQMVNNYIASYHATAEDATDEEKSAARETALKEIADMGYSEAEYVQANKDSAIYDKVQAEVVKDVAVTDEEVQAAFNDKVKSDESQYKDNIGMYEYMTQYYGQTSYYVPAGYRGITHILLSADADLLNKYQELSAKLEEQEQSADAQEETPTDTATTDDTSTTDPEATAEPTEEPVTQEMVDAARAAVIASVQPTIDEINEKLKAGTSFADLVSEYGTDPGMTQEPNKTNGYSVHKDSIIWDPAFVKAAFSVDNVGDIAEPVVGSYGVHIVQYTRDVPEGAVEFTDEVKSALYEEALYNKESEVFNTTMDEWLGASEITYATAPAADDVPTDGEATADDTADDTTEAAE